MSLAGESPPATGAPRRGSHLVLAGAGHAHLMTIAALGRFTARGHRVTVVGPDPFHYYSGMGPGMLGGCYRPEAIRFPVARMTEERGGCFIRDRVVALDPAACRLELASGGTLCYDVLSFNIGSSVPILPVEGLDTPSVFPVKPIENLLKARERIVSLAGARPLLNLAVIGGGAAALEIAGNLWQLCASKRIAARIAVFAGRRFLAAFPARLRQKALLSLQARSIAVHEGAYAREVSRGQVHLDSGAHHAVDLVLVASGVRPPTLFSQAGLPVGPEGGLRVDRYLRSINGGEIFGGGDCIHFDPLPLDRVGVYAVRQNPVLRYNLLAALEGRALRSFDPGGSYLLIFNLGDGHGLALKWGRVFHGRLAFHLKDWIDRRFMRRFH